MAYISEWVWKACSLFYMFYYDVKYWNVNIVYDIL